MKQISIFDLDGTLIDAYSLIHISLNFTRRKLGYNELDYHLVKKSVGGGDIGLIKKFFKEEDRDNALKIYRETQKQYINKENVKLQKGAKEILLLLKEKKIKITIATNRNKFAANLVLEKLNITNYFDLVFTADDVKEKKPSPEIIEKIYEKFNCSKEECFYVGDMDIDLKTGLNAGVDTYIVLTGSSTLDEILKVEKEANVFSDLIELKNFLLNNHLI